MILGRVELGRAVSMYHKATSAKRGPIVLSQYPRTIPIQGSTPEVIAMNTWKTDRSGYRSPIVADTEGNHSTG